MKKRFIYLLLLFAVLLGYFLLQKPVFMLCNDAWEKGASFADLFRVIGHGASLDATTAGYLTVIPWLAVFISCWVRRFPLRKVLVPYYILNIISSLNSSNNSRAFSELSANIEMPNVRSL